MPRGILAILVPQFGNNFFTCICVALETIAQRAGLPDCLPPICDANGMGMRNKG